MKKLFFGLSLLLISHSSVAEVCPDIRAIKENTAKGWKIYDSDDGKLLSAKRAAHYRTIIEKFSLAEWVRAKQHQGSIHCYYSNNTGSSLEAYVAKDNIKPNNYKNVWYKVSGYMHCAAGVEQCEFGNKLFAKKEANPVS